ncbi:3-oxoacyl-[acyl-carrier protein] reductase [Crossiella equi]|uniref:3-oxoacyl-[acyl-carrier protein] reductase n=1 Tax=Crossiella equi TaxID=130796 RepID=A0ABS5A939_9PSEU|nr:SDR family oxidoreductase [Crossiella equi]MBP2473086.1 3-oxoacyl-[acyl-carrier protein] reductase [Crossiella equi]
MDKHLHGRVALVTGGSRGIGAGIARRLAADGAKVALTYLTSPDRAEAVVEEIAAAGGTAIAIKANAADEQQVQASVEQTVAAFGGLDILVHNAGGGVFKTVEETTLADFDATFGVNVRGAYAAILAALPHLGEGSRIITIGSVNGIRSPIAGMALYSAAKSSVAGLTRALARDLGPRGITVNNVAPGPIDTDANPAQGGFSDVMRSVMALPEYGTTADIGSFVSYLAGTEAGFITGADLVVDGGYAA